MVHQSKVVSEAGAAMAARVNDLQDSVDKYASLSAKAFNALAQMTTDSLSRTKATLGRVLIANSSLDAAMAEMKRVLDGVVRRVDQLEWAPPTTVSQPQQPQRMGPLRTEGQGNANMPQGTDQRGF